MLTSSKGGGSLNADRGRVKFSKILLTSCIQDTLSSRAALGLPRLAECVARAKVSCIQADVICEHTLISIKCMYEIAVLAKIFLKYVIYTVLLIFQERHPNLGQLNKLLN